MGKLYIISRLTATDTGVSRAPTDQAVLYPTTSASAMIYIRMAEVLTSSMLMASLYSSTQSHDVYIVPVLVAIRFVPSCLRLILYMEIFFLIPKMLESS